MQSTNAMTADKDPFAWVPDFYRNLINDPAQRLKMRSNFYSKYGFKKSRIPMWILNIIRFITNDKGFGISELNFMKWEISRGVLNPIDHKESPGSVWWSNVNLKFVITAQLATEIYEKKRKADESLLTNEVNHWLDYLHNRTAQNWYKAHNAAIISAYLEFTHLAHDESVYEQAFMNEVLYRVIFAQAMVQGDSVFKLDGEIAANPMLPSVDLLVHIPSFYPGHYPLSESDILNVMHEGHGLDADLENVLDNLFIYPHIPELYTSAAGWTNIPHLVNLQSEGKPIYPKHSI